MDSNLWKAMSLRQLSGSLPHMPASSWTSPPKSKAKEYVSSLVPSSVHRVLNPCKYIGNKELILRIEELDTWCWMKFVMKPKRLWNYEKHCSLYILYVGFLWCLWSSNIGDSKDVSRFRWTALSCTSITSIPAAGLLCTQTRTALEVRD